MLWLSLLSLVTTVKPMPLRTQDLPTKWSHVESSGADWEFAEVFTHVYVRDDPESQEDPSQLDLQYSVLEECSFISSFIAVWLCLLIQLIDRYF